jgi:hypothetical protein
MYRATVLASLALLVCCLTVAAAQRRPPEEEDDSRQHDIVYSTEVATPHVDWAAKLPGGPIKGFFIPSIHFGRDMVELMQRLDLQPATVSIDRDWDVNCWGIGDFYSHRERGDRDDFRIVYGYVEKYLTGPDPFEVMVIPGLNGWSRMTRATRDAILRRVQDGAGLVLVHPFIGDVKGHPFAGDETQGDARLWEISPLVDCPDDTIDDGGYPVINKEAIASGKWEVTHPHFITDGVPLDLLPEGTVGGSFYKYRATGDVLIKSGEYPILAVKQYGKGRVVALAYQNEGFMPQGVDQAETRINWDYWEYQYSLLARAILWAAHRDPAVRVAAFTASSKGMTLTLDAKQAGSVHLSTQQILLAPPDSRSASQTALRPGANRIDLPMPPPGPGRNILNVIVRDAAGATLDWSTATFVTPQPATLAEVTTDAQFYPQEGTLNATARAEGEVGPLRVRFRVMDDLDRVLAEETRPAVAETRFTYRLADFVGKSAVVTAQLVDSKGLVIDQISAKPLLVVQKERRPREFQAQIGFNSVRPYFRSARLNQIRAAGVDIGMTWTEGVNNGLDVPHDSFGVYAYHRGPSDEEGIAREIARYQQTGDYGALSYNARKALFQRTKDEKLLVRVPCFDDPAFMADLRQRVRASAESKARYHMDYYFVGDEGSLTSYGDAYDFCWSGYTLAAFREWLKKEYASLDALNREWGTDFTSWEMVVPYTTEEAVGTGRFAPWADHRTFMEVTFAGAYQAVRDAVVAGDPDGHIAVSGTQGTNAYNGCDWYQLDQVIDDFLSYAGGNQWDLHRSFAKPGAMVGFWTGYGSSGLGVQNAIWTAAIHNVFYPQIFWIYSYLDPDFTYSNSARDMGEAFKALRYEGVGKLLIESQRQQDGIAIHYSMPSVHAAAISLERKRTDDEQVHNFGRNRDGWVRVLNDLGLQFDFVASDQVERGALGSGKYRVLVLPLSAALSPEEVKAITRFVEGGGIVIADAAAGMMDDHCSWVKGGALNALFGISTAPSDERHPTSLPDAAAATEAGAGWGLQTTLLADTPAVEALRATTGTALARMGESDAVVVRQVGKGWAIYLNTALDGYSRSRRREYGGANYRHLVGALLNHLGVRPAIDVLDVDGQPLDQAQVVRYRFCDAEVLAIVKENVGIRAVEGRDGVTVYQDANLGEVAAQDLVIKLPRKRYVANVRTGERFGLTDTVRVPITVGGALVLAMSDAEDSLSLSGPTAATRGEHPRFAIHSSTPGKALARCHFLAPDGTFLPAYERNVLLQNGAGEVVLPSALSDAEGTYTLQVTNITTGAAAEAKVTLR